MKSDLSFKSSSRAKVIPTTNDTEYTVPRQKEKKKSNLFQRKKSTRVENISKNEYERDSFDGLFLSLRADYKLSGYSVYYFSGCEKRLLAGEQLTEIALDSYRSLPSTSVYVNPNGICYDSRYMSRYVTRIYDDNGGMYIICLSSYSLEAFNNNVNVLTLNICNYFGKSILGGDET